MSPISVYVAVGAISFVKCQLSSATVEASQLRIFNEFYEGDWKAGDHFNGGKSVDTTEREQKKKKPGKENDILRGLVYMKRIYEECKKKSNKSFEGMVKRKVKSILGQQLSIWKDYFLSFYKCVKVTVFRCMDEVLEEDIFLSQHVSLVKDAVNETAAWDGRAAGQRPLREYVDHILRRSWSSLVYERLVGLLKSHSLKFHLNQGLVIEGRGRRRDHRMFAMMVMGFMIMASILIPMGFQFLTVLGGKSLLMAKMALIMSAISGLKKIATSNVGYGFYHTGADGHHHDHVHHGFHEKLYQSPPNQIPFNQ